jgi:5'(3')-deoxyribonucleotidase
MDKNMIYVDMDGVIADFFGGLERFHGVKHWKVVKEDSILALRNTNFFYTLDPFETSGQLIQHVRELTGGMDWGINTSPLRNDNYNSAYWKRRWLEDYAWFPEASRFIVTGRKEKYATAPFDGKPNILIDDKPSNIKAWNDKGGIGIRYQANEDDLEEYLFVQLDEALASIK